ncbi:hypothetical protein D3C76_154940 [compost metagenome]
MSVRHGGRPTLHIFAPYHHASEIFGLLRKRLIEVGGSSVHGPNFSRDAEGAECYSGVGDQVAVSGDRAHDLGSTSRGRWLG